MPKTEDDLRTDIYRKLQLMTREQLLYTLIEVNLIIAGIESTNNQYIKLRKENILLKEQCISLQKNFVESKSIV